MLSSVKQKQRECCKDRVVIFSCHINVCIITVPAFNRGAYCRCIDVISSQSSTRCCSTQREFKKHARNIWAATGTQREQPVEHVSKGNPLEPDSKPEKGTHKPGWQMEINMANGAIESKIPGRSSRRPAPMKGTKNDTSRDRRPWQDSYLAIYLYRFQIDRGRCLQCLQQ